MGEPTADFSASPTTGTAPLGVQFIDNSTGWNLSYWTWDFENDGIIDSYEQYPVHTYPVPGSYSVRMTVFDEFGQNDTLVRPSYINVAALPVPVADFSGTPQSGYSPLTVQFTDESTGSGIFSWVWDFDNDGMPDSFDPDPAHTYTAAGNYTVSLTVSNAADNSTEVKTGYVTVVNPLPVPVADFSGTPQSGYSPLTVQFTDESSGSGIFSYVWDFQNDGMPDSFDPDPAYTYTAAGNYTVALTVSNAAGNVTEVKTGYITVANPPAPVAMFTASPTYGKRPLTVQFTDQSTGTGITSWAWDFQNDGSIDSTARNPVFTYKSRGYYSVKLTVINAGGSDSLTRWFYIRVK